MNLVTGHNEISRHLFHTFTSAMINQGHSYSNVLSTFAILHCASFLQPNPKSLPRRMQPPNSAVHFSKLLWRRSCHILDL